MPAFVLEPFFHVVGLLSCAVFVLAFKFVASEICRSHEQVFEPMLPRAVLCLNGGGVGSRWLRGRTRQRSLFYVRAMQTAIVAFGMTAAFIMFLCTAGIVAIMLIGLI